MRPPRLAIDAAAGASRLAGGALQGPWQVPAELARSALRRGARRVDVRCHDRSFSVTDDGAPPEGATCEQVARALDPHASAEDRDRALAALEAGPAAELRYLAALPGARVSLASPGTRGLTVTADAIAWDAAEARSWLLSVARFAGDRVALDGTPVPQDHPPHVAAAALAPPRAGRLWLPLSGEEGALWLIEDGIVSAFLVAPSAVPFVALVDLTGRNRLSGDGAALREAVARDVGAFQEDAARLVLRAAANVPALDAPRLRRLRVMLLAVARLKHLRSEALHARAFLARDRTAARWLSLVELAAPAMLGADRRVPTCPPEAVGTSLFPTVRPAVVLEARERARLAQELGLRFRVLPRTERGLARTWRATAADALRRCRVLFLPSRPIASARLSPDERVLLAAVTDGHAAFGTGAGPVRWDRGRLLLPRGNADVRAAVRALARDPDQAFAAVLALAGTAGPEALRTRWRARCGPVHSSDLREDV